MHDLNKHFFSVCGFTSVQFEAFFPQTIAHLEVSPTTHTQVCVSLILCIELSRCPPFIYEFILPTPIASQSSPPIHTHIHTPGNKVKLLLISRALHNTHRHSDRYALGQMATNRNVGKEEEEEEWKKKSSCFGYSQLGYYTKTTYHLLSIQHVTS